MIRSDRDGEYESCCEEIFLKYDIIHQTTTLYLTQSNDMIERKNRKRKEHDEYFSDKFCFILEYVGTTIHTTNKILNRISHKK